MTKTGGPWRLGRAVALSTAVFLGCGRDSQNVAARQDYRAAVERLSAFIDHEMADKELPALSIVLVDDQETVWARGYGMADPSDGVAATAATVYRVGSVSKLFTDLTVMQLVEQGTIDLDAPITQYLPDFQPQNAFGEAITLRQLMSHRSGLVREPPIGHYFDDTTPSLAATVESLNRSSIVYQPEARTKYSNAGIAAVGLALQQTVGTPFTDYLKQSVLVPLGAEQSAFAPEPAVVRRLATGYMWSLDGRTFPAPTFELGMAPAGSMYAPVTDLGRFMSAVFAGGMGARGRVVRSETLEQMLTPQFAAPGATEGYGIGFRLSALDGHRRIGHGGAIYGFATDLSALPDDKLGAAAVTTLDGANTVVGRITEYALRLMLAVREGRPLPDAPVTQPLPDEVAHGLAGRYRSATRQLDIFARDDDTYAFVSDPDGRRSERRWRLRAVDDRVVVDGRLAYGPTLSPVGEGPFASLELDGDTLLRVDVPKPPPAPARWLDLIGEYGWDYNTLYVLEKNQRLYALIEWFYLDPLDEVARDVFAFPEGLYTGERLAFRRGPDGRVTGVEAAGILFERRAVGPESGQTFAIEPVRPVAEIRREALAAAPPREEGDFLAPDLVELKTLDSTIRYDIRYASTNNFMRSVFYDEARAFLQRPAAEALVRVHRRLGASGYGLLIHDAYRPWYVTKMFWDATPEDMKIFVADPRAGSRHNRGAAVDLTLFDRSTGRAVTMVGGYDEFSQRSFPEYVGGTSRQRWLRERLRASMEAEGFRVYEFEWWHFDYGDWHRYPISNLTFDEIPR